MSRCYSLSLVLFCTLCYGLSIFFNGGASSPPAQTLLVLGSTRCLTLLLSAFFLLPPSGAAPALLSLPLALPTLAPIGVVLLGNAGMLAFVTLAELEAGSSSSGLVSGLVSLYMVLPVVYGIVRRGEGAPPRKLAGVALSLAATLLLGLAPAASGAPGLLTGPAAAAKLLLLAAACACWGAMDIFSATLTRSAPVLAVVLLSALGQAITAALAGLWVCGSSSSSSPSPSSPSSSTLGNLGRLMGGNALGVLGWLAFVVVGGQPGSEVSSFAPLISLYVFLPVTISLLGGGGEGLSGLQAAGLALAVAGALAIAWDWGGRGAQQQAAAAAAPAGAGVGGAAAAAAVAAAAAASAEAGALAAQGVGLHVGAADEDIHAAGETDALSPKV